MSALTGARHLLAQRRVLAALGGTITEAAAQRLGLSHPRRDALSLPGPEVSVDVPAPPPALVQQYLRHVGGELAAYRGQLPPHLFPQWTVPVAARVLRGLPFPMLKVINGGCRVELRGPVPAGSRLRVRAQLVQAEDDGRKVVLRQRIVTGAVAAPEALHIELSVIVPRPTVDPRDDKREARKGPARVPSEARELALWRLPADAGLTYGFLTGDLNPLHWAPPYARAAGFRSAILHGFSTMARAMEGIIRHMYAGAVGRLGGVDVRFTRPLVLPARVGLYVREHELYVGDAPGGPAYLTGTFWEANRE
jgi:acyl dehydratase